PGFRSPPLSVSPAPPPISPWCLSVRRPRLSVRPPCRATNSYDVTARLFQQPGRSGIPMNSTPVGDASGPIRRWLEGHLDDMTADLAELVSRESPSSDAALKRDFVAWLLPWIAERVADTQGLLVEPVDANGHTAVIRVGESAAAADTVVALSHFDTVWE